MKRILKTGDRVVIRLPLSKDIFDNVACVDGRNFIAIKLYENVPALLNEHSTSHIAATGSIMTI